MKRTVLIALLSLLVFCLLLLVPLPDNQGDRFMVYLQDFAHFPLFAMMAWLLLFLFGGKSGVSLSRGFLVVVATLVVGLLAEFIQPFVGRTAGGRDILLGVAGGVAGVCVNLGARGARAMGVAFALVLAAAAAFPLVLIGRDRQAAHRDFPLLASFESRTELGRWSVHGCKISRVADRTTHGRWALKIEVENSDNYPGLFESDSIRNLSGIKQLCFDAFVPGTAPLRIWLRMDDRINPAYSERFQDLRTLFPGTNTICIERATIGSTPSGRSLELNRIRSWGVFFDQAQPGDVLYLDNVRVLPE